MIPWNYVLKETSRIIGQWKWLCRAYFFLKKYADMRTWTETRELSDLGEKMRNASN